jgi:hypothetical protein
VILGRGGFGWRRWSDPREVEEVFDLAHSPNSRSFQYLYVRILQLLSYLLRFVAVRDMRVSLISPGSFGVSPLLACLPA